MLLSLEGCERLVAKLKQQEGYDADIEALWVREAEARYDEIATGKALDEAIGDARRALK